MFWNEDFLDELREYVSDKIAKLQYHVDSKWSDAKITSKEVENGKVVLTALITEKGAFTIDGVRLVDSDNNVIAETAENLVKNSDVLTMQWSFPLYEYISL